MKGFNTGTLTTLFVVAVGLTSRSQDFVVDLKGDTLKGSVKLITNGYDKRVQVQGASKEKKTLSIMQVKTVTMNNERFDPVRFSTTYVFMKLIHEGYLSLYAFQIEKQLSFDGLYLLKKDGKGMEVPNLGFKKHMNAFLQECEGISRSVSSGEMGRSDLKAIVDKFNACIVQNTAMLSEVKKSETISTVPEPWHELQQNVEASSIENKSDVLEMIKDAKSKLSRGEKLPNFLVEGLKSSLRVNTELSELLAKALSTLH